MKIASYNIAGIKARMPALTAWLEDTNPDVVILQEVKSVDENFPREHFENMGYNVAAHGQKSFNGVAILSKFPLEDVMCGLPGDDSDEQARYIEATVINEQAIRICGLYLPNGNPVDFDADGAPIHEGKYGYKLGWMARLLARAEELMTREEPFLMAGDYNIIPQPEDAARPEAWTKDALFLPDSQNAFRKLVNLGLTEAFRTLNPAPEQYTFWDFQRGAWQRNDGIRIDHFLLSPECADLLTDCQIDKEIRGREKPSDHVPIWVQLAAQHPPIRI